MDSFGLPNGVIEKIIHKLAEFSLIESVKIYGSRALGNYWRGSDIDLALFGKCGSILGKIITELDELPLPYKFDVLAYEQITNLELKEHIERIGILIYQKASH